ncbi:Ig-like domain repeat protein [uncultured Methanobrevibacter sp.]|uniref:Ig-like domain repeat protein n=1 Tax=uncultured Methanobrevibacter sp. TaxID=253161 RepID=UPI002618F77F|nr:Ig-like domain repeat protein [uncultured Methanobrevibacter sp.]
MKFVSPIDNSNVNGMVKIKTSIRTHTAIDDKGVTFKISGPNNYEKVISDKNPNDGWECVWDTGSVPNGKYTIKAEAWDVDYPDGPGTKTIFVNLNNVKKETKLTVNNIKTSENTNVNIMATLKDNSNKPILNKKIQFSINGKAYNAITDNGGIAKINFKSNKGIYAINAKFLGDNVYSTSSGTGKLTIVKNSYNLKVTNIFADKNKKTQIKSLLTYNNKKIANKLVNFYVDNKYVGSSKTNKNGVATIDYKVKLSTGRHTVSAKYGNDLVNTATLKVKSAGLYSVITTNKAKPKVGTLVTIFYRIKNDGPDSATNTKLTYKITSGLQYVKAIGNGSKKYNSKTKTFTWTISKAKVGTSLIKLVFKTKKPGRVLLTPKITTDTYNTYNSFKKVYITIV